MDELSIQTARTQDWAGVLRIYNHYVLTSHVTFDLKTESLEERQDWFARFADASPHQLWVALKGHEVVGYASSSQLRPKPAYRSSVETSVYLAEGHQGCGLGTKLYGTLLKALSDVPSLHRAYGCIALPNESSVRLHEKLGFAKVGHFHDAGFKFGRFWDVAWYEKELA